MPGIWQNSGSSSKFLFKTKNQDFRSLILQFYIIACTGFIIFLMNFDELWFIRQNEVRYVSILSITVNTHNHANTHRHTHNLKQEIKQFYYYESLITK